MVSVVAVFCFFQNADMEVASSKLANVSEDYPNVELQRTVVQFKWLHLRISTPLVALGFPLVVPLFNQR